MMVRYIVLFRSMIELVRTNKYEMSLSALLVVSCAANVFLVRQVRGAEAALRSALSSEEVPLDEILPLVEGVGLDGRELSVDLGHQIHGSVLFVYSPACHPSNGNWHNWQTLLREFSDTGPTPIFVDLSGETRLEFVRQHQLSNYQIFASVSALTRSKFKFHGTPQTIIVDPSGRAQWVRTGGLTPASLSEFRHTLRILSSS